MYLPIKLAKNFIDDETGTVMAETVIVLPMLLWSYLALFVYWDSFRSMNTVQKASYTLSDMISREMTVLPASYFDGLKSVMEILISKNQDVKLRVTSITYDQAHLKFVVLWSYSPNGDLTELTTDQLQLVKSQIPAMSDGDYATIVETEVPFVPAFNVGMNATTLKQFIITRPRFVAPNCMVGRTCTGA